jgi:hypothetical protein
MEGFNAHTRTLEDIGAEGAGIQMYNPEFSSEATSAHLQHVLPSGTLHLVDNANSTVGSTIPSVRKFRTFPLAFQGSSAYFTWSDVLQQINVLSGIVVLLDNVRSIGFDVESDCLRPSRRDAAAKCRCTLRSAAAVSGTTSCKGAKHSIDRDATYARVTVVQPRKWQHFSCQLCFLPIVHRRAQCLLPGAYA